MKAAAETLTSDDEAFQVTPVVSAECHSAGYFLPRNSNGYYRTYTLSVFRLSDFYDTDFSVNSGPWQKSGGKSDCKRWLEINK